MDWLFDCTICRSKENKEIVDGHQVGLFVACLVSRSGISTVFKLEKAPEIHIHHNR